MGSVVLRRTAGKEGVAKECGEEKWGGVLRRIGRGVRIGRDRRVDRRVDRVLVAGGGGGG